VSKSAFLDVALNQSTNAVDLTIAQKETGGENPGGENPGGEIQEEETRRRKPGGENPGGENPGSENPGSGKPGIFQTVAKSSNQWNTAGALSTLTQSGPSLALYNSLLVLSAPEAREAFNQLSGEVYPSIQSNLIAGSTQVFNVLNQRMQRAFDNDSLPIPPFAMSLVQQPEPQNNGVWGQTFSSWAETTATVTWASWTAIPPASCWGQIASWRIITCVSVATSATAAVITTSTAVVPQRIPITTTLACMRRVNRMRSPSRRAGLHWHKIEGERSVDFSGFSDRLKSDYDANSLLAFTEAGYRFGQPDMNIEPFVNLSYIRLHTDSFREDGGAAALSVSNETMNTFYSTLGVRVTELPKNVNLYGSLGWQHAYGDKNTSSRMAFAGSDAFITQGQAVDEDVMVGDIGVSVQLSRAATLDVGYQGQYGADTRVNSVNANLRWSF
jgi:uncharacterized protein with beta-barrel porin domain